MQSSSDINRHHGARTVQGIAILCGGLLGLAGVVMAAAGAHIAANPSDAAHFASAAQMAGWHALALLAVACLADRCLPRWASYAATALFALGTLLFSGTVAGNVLGLTLPGVLAPTGGTLIMLGWMVAAVGGTSLLGRLHD